MRVNTLWLACLLAVAGLFAPPTARAQTEDGALPDPIVPLPLYHNHPGKGGFFANASFVYWRQTNPIKDQTLAVRGFWDTNGNITGTVGQFVGSGAPALNANDAGGPGTYQPGSRIGLGWRFQDGSSIELGWLYLTQARYAHIASIVPPNYQFGQLYEDSFLSSPTFNFTSFFAGPAHDIFLGGEYPAYGIWNAAEEMTVSFVQRTQQWDITYRVPVYDTECWRTYGLVGPRFFWIWERFRWRTVDMGTDVTTDATLGPVYSNINPQDVANYSNVVSNRMYGAFLGCGNEWYLGKGFAFSLDIEGTLYMDLARQQAKWQLTDGACMAPGQSKRSLSQWYLVPEARANASLWWYPIEGVQIRLGYDVIGMFNTVGAKYPVSFNVGSVDPKWSNVGRVFDGFQAGIGLIF